MRHNGLNQKPTGGDCTHQAETATEPAPVPAAEPEPEPVAEPEPEPVAVAVAAAEPVAEPEPAP